MQSINNIRNRMMLYSKYDKLNDITFLVNSNESALFVTDMVRSII